MGWLARLLGEHTAELRGVKVRFHSAGGRGSHMLWSDAVQACKQAGAYRSQDDSGKILVDGVPNEITRW